MKKIGMLLALCFLFFTGIAQGVPVTVTGHVFNQADNSGLPDWIVLASFDSLSPIGSEVTITDNTGAYSLTFEFSDVNGTARIYTIDGCTGDLVPQDVSLTNGVGTADFSICIDTTGWGGGSCEADFYPQPDFSNPLAVTFQDYSYGQVTTWAWDFGDGNTSTDSSPTHTYANPGGYEVTLEITTADGCTSTSTYYYMTPPVLGDPVTVTGYVRYEGTNSPVEGWPVFGETDPFGGPFGSVAITDQNGYYELVADLPTGQNTLEVSTFDFCSPSPLFETVTVTNGMGTADFLICYDSFPPPPVGGCHAMVDINPVDDYTYSFSVTVHPSNSTPAAYMWDFGDGTTSTDANPTHTYTNDGVYTVYLEVETDSCVAHACELVFVGSGHPPCDTFFYGCQAMFFPNFADPTALYTVDFIDASLGVVGSYAWDFGDGTTSTDANPSHTYAADGVYTVTLDIETIDGCESSIEMDLVVPFDFGFNEFDCQAMFLPLPVPDSVTGTVGLSYFFIDMSFAPMGITSYAWDFGDGSTSTEPSPLHTYAVPGNYNVTLVINGDSCDSQVTFLLNTANFGQFTGGGSFGQSSLVLGTKNLTSIEAVRMAPNPVTDRAVLAFDSKTSETLRYSIIDATGSSVRTWTSNTTQGANATEVQTADLTPGLYNLSIQGQGGLQTLRFVKQ